MVGLGRIRVASIADWRRWLGMRCRLFPDRPSHQHESEMEMLLEGQPRIQAVFLYEDAAGVVRGFVELSRCELLVGFESQPVCRVGALYVEPEERRGSIGRQLVERAEAWAHERGLDNLWLGMAARYRDSLPPLASLGFVVTDKLVVLKKKVVAPIQLFTVAVDREEVSIGTAEPVSTPVWESQPRLVAGTTRIYQIHAMIMVLGILALLNTDIYTGNVVTGAVLPLLDLGFVMYLFGLLGVWLYRGRIATADRTGEMYTVDIAQQRPSETLRAVARSTPERPEPNSH